MRATSLFRLAAAGALLVMASGAAAAAAPAGSSAKPTPTNTRAPIDVTADHAVSYNNECKSVWTGHAEALQDNARLRGDEFTSFTEKVPSGKPGGSPTCGALVRLEATGSVYYVNPEEKVHGDKAVYVAADDTITVTGSEVVAVRGKNVLRGNRMVINNKTGEGQMEGSATGLGKSGRPRGIFYPKETQNSGQAKPASAAKGPRASATLTPASPADR